MRLDVFNVGRGLCVLIQTPSDHLVMIDCGCDPTRDQAHPGFSPAKWIAKHRGSSAQWYQFHLLTWLIVTHPHDDHVEDIDNLISFLPPAFLVREKQLPWDRVLNPPNGDPSANAKRFHEWQEGYNGTIVEAPDLGCNLTWMRLPYEIAAPRWSDTQHLLNNMSLVTIFDWLGGWKIVVMGDNEAAGLRALLENPIFREAIRGADILVTPHHGHESGYCPELFEEMGKPHINISSEILKDPTVSPSYSSQARGLEIDGRTRTHLTTRSDGHIIFELTDGKRYAFERI